jgi:GTP-binding protein EngB required for normal cell division
MVICFVGAASSGKTILLKKLALESVDESTKTLPTVGINHFNVSVDSPPPASQAKRLFFCRKQHSVPRTVQAKELGGELAQNWTEYLRAESRLVYVIDASNPALIAEVAVHFVNCVDTVSRNAGAKVLVAFSKSDLIEGDKEVRLNAIRSLLRLSHVQEFYGGVDFTQVSYSAWEDVLLIREWIKDC